MSCCLHQIFNDILFYNADAKKQSIFIAQPVLRTQYLSTIKQGNALSFVNVATCSVNINEQQHYDNLQLWIDLLIDLGMKKEKIYFKIKDNNRKWGDKRMDGKTIFIIYDGLELGDASYMPTVSHESGENISISDIGFGLERIKWVLSGGKFFDISSFDDSSEHRENIDERNLACLQTLSLLSLEGIKPSNKKHGYRFRLFSKKIVESLQGEFKFTEKLLMQYISYWKIWSKFTAEQSAMDIVKVIMKENERNFNRLLLDTLNMSLKDRVLKLDINLSTDELINRLSNANLDENMLKATLNQLKYNKK